MCFLSDTCLLSCPIGPGSTWAPIDLVQEIGLTVVFLCNYGVGIDMSFPLLVNSLCSNLLQLGMLECVC